MNKLMQNKRIWNHVRIQPIKIHSQVSRMTEKHQIEWCESIWNHLLNDDLTRHAFYSYKGIGCKKHTLSVWSDDKYVYLVQVLRTRYNTNESTVYITKNTTDNINDFKAMAKMVHNNINVMENDYKQMIIDAKESQTKSDGQA